MFTRLLSVALAAVGTAWPGRPPETTVQPSSPPTRVALCGSSPVGATSSRYYDGRWRLNGPGWTGGDGTLSVPLPDGRDVWLFGDTFLGTIDATGRRPLGGPWTHNSLVIQQAGRVSTLTGPGDTALIPAEAPGAWSWPGSGIVEGRTLRVFAHEFARCGDGTWDLDFLRTRIASFSLPGLGFLGFDRISARGDVIWGNWVLGDSGWTYIYGVPESAANTAYVARVPRGHLRGPWQYFDGGAWSTDPAAARPFAGALPNQFGVVKVPGGYSLISMGVAFDPSIFARFARTPSGPFGPPRLLYTAPLLPITYVYGAVPHPEILCRGGLLVSYNVNVQRFQDLFTHPEDYRPRFITVPLSALRR